MVDSTLNLWRCGSGDGCAVMLPRRGLCPQHSAEIRAAWERVSAGSRRTRLGIRVDPERPRRRPIPERAAKAARFVHEQGRRVSRADVAQALGMARGGSISRALAHAREAGWIVSVQGPDGGIIPGDVKPPAAS